MKATFLSSVLALGLLAGCNERTSPPEKNSTTDNPPRTDYLSTTATAKQRATKTLDAVSLNKAIEAFYVSEGRFPKDLLELVELSYLPSLPNVPTGMSWEYDTNTGIASITKETSP